ncbi:MAG: cytochrome c [Archangiaceae bacterium]|nr:cytochrome c [Archangiaceae bacterium]
MRSFSLVVVLTLCACPKKEEAPLAQPPPPAPVDDCTFETKLVPGVPGSPGHLIASERNPNGASELATHMRMMVDDVRDAKSKVLAGQPVPTLFAKHRKIRCTWPTAASDRNEAFDAMAQNYLAQVKALDAKPADMKAAYSDVVRACRTCHEATCDGPIAVIDGLALDAK